MPKEDTMLKRIMRTTKVTLIVIGIICGIIVFVPIIAYLIFAIVLNTRYSPKDYIPLSVNEVVATQHEYSARFVPKREGEHSLRFNVKELKYVNKTNLNFVVHSNVKMRYSDGSVEEFLMKKEMKGVYHLYHSYVFATFHVRKFKKSKPCAGEFMVRIEGDLSPIACDKVKSFIVSKFSETL